MADWNIALSRLACPYDAGAFSLGDIPVSRGELSPDPEPVSRSWEPDELHFRASGNGGRFRFERRLKTGEAALVGWAETDRGLRC